MNAPILTTEWVDYTRKNDPACNAALKMFRDKLNSMWPKLPRVVCFWTKNADGLAELYGETIRKLQGHGVTVLSHFTVTGYGCPLEPGVPEPSGKELVKLLGQKAIRLRFDPIILGYANPKHFKKCLEQADNMGVDEIIVNFLVPEYKDVSTALPSLGIQANRPTKERVLEALSKLRALAPRWVSLRACAETSILLGNDRPEWLAQASCASPEWAIKVNPDLGPIIGHASRKGCGCVYSADWGLYPSQGGYACPHRCAYCYAK